MSFAYKLLVIVYLKKEKKKAYYADVEHTDHHDFTMQLAKKYTTFLWICSLVYTRKQKWA